VAPPPLPTLTDSLSRQLQRDSRNEVPSSCVVLGFETWSSRAHFDIVRPQSCTGGGFSLSRRPVRRAHWLVNVSGGRVNRDAAHCPVAARRAFSLAQCLVTVPLFGVAWFVGMLREIVSSERPRRCTNSFKVIGRIVRLMEPQAREATRCGGIPVLELYINHKPIVCRTCQQASPIVRPHYFGHLWLVTIDVLEGATTIRHQIACCAEKLARDRSPDLVRACGFCWFVCRLGGIERPVYYRTASSCAPTSHKPNVCEPSDKLLECTHTDALVIPEELPPTEKKSRTRNLASLPRKSESPLRTGL